MVGSQWGDEGKGKIVDWLSKRADVVVRFQGGHNAGHTLVIDGKVYKLSLLPSGIVRGGKYSVIGNGVVVDPWALLKEIELLTSQGVTVNSDNLMLAENCALILPLHWELDGIREAPNGAMRAKAKLLIGCLNGPMWWSGFRAAIMRAIPWSLMAKSISSACCLPVSSGAANIP